VLLIGHVANSSRSRYNRVQPDPHNASTSAWSCENPITLKGDLKGSQGLNFTGFVMSDWIALQSPPWTPNAPAPSLPSGLDMEMPGSDHFHISLVTAALAVGNITAAMIDESVARILSPMFAVGVMDAEEVRKRRRFGHAVYAPKPELCQDRLGTNASETLGNRGARFCILQGAYSVSKHAVNASTPEHIAIAQVRTRSFTPLTLFAWLKT
jgi:beta-glucosidase-like glycosyl hydrolase